MTKILYLGKKGLLFLGETAGMAAPGLNTVPSLTLRAFMGLGVIREGLLKPREPAYGDKRRQDAEAQSTSE